MFLTTDHLRALDTLAARAAAGHAPNTAAEDVHTQNLFHALELQGFVLPEAAQSYRRFKEKGVNTVESLAFYCLSRLRHIALLECCHHW